MNLDPSQAVMEFARECREKMAEYEKAIVRCGVIGIAGSGKSSLINAIAGERVCEAGVTETTMEAQEYHHHGLIFVDLPGCGTEKHPRDSYVSRHKLASYDLFIIVASNRWREDDTYLVKELTRMGKSFFVVRSMLDLAVEAARRDNGLSEAETRKKIERNLLGHLRDVGVQRVFLVSAWHPALYDLEALLESIAKGLNGVKRQRFYADMAAVGEDGLKRKREVLEKLLPYYAGAAAANGLNPMPGLDIAADLSILMKFASEVATVYGLDKKSVDFMQRMFGIDRAPALVAKIAQFTAKYLAKEGLLIVLRTFATQTAGKQMAKWVPFAGPLIAAGIGWKTTFMLGEDLIDEAEQLAREMIETIVRQTATA
jgi:GTP-binding protein EngB required for normal cell division